MIRLPPRSTRTGTLFPYTTLFRSWDAWPTGVWDGGRKSRAEIDFGASADYRPRLIPAGQICPALFVCDHYSISGMTDEAHLSAQPTRSEAPPRLDRKSTRLNSSH